MEMKKEKKPKAILNIDGTEYKTILPEDFEKRIKYHLPELDLIRSFIAGNIRKVNVKEGQKIKKGDKLIILEAMKMKNRVLAPITGKVKRIYVKEGENVRKDQLLLKIEPDNK